MRLKNLILGDIKFQFKYGFYFLYLFLSIIYILTQQQWDCFLWELLYFLRKVKGF